MPYRSGKLPGRGYKIQVLSVSSSLTFRELISEEPASQIFGALVAACAERDFLRKRVN
jgi:hypothetical protein